jgi:hypothetical protein
MGNAPAAKYYLLPVSYQRRTNLRPVFIVGCSRTGSTLLQSLLNRYTNIDILSETHFLVPNLIHRDFASAIRPFNGLSDEIFVTKVLDLMASKRLFGVFWEKDFSRDMDMDYLKKALLASEKNLKGIFSAVMEAHARSKGKKNTGAKFPFYICYAHKLLDFYDEALIIHTIRDPRAIFASQYFKRRIKNGNFLQKVIIAVTQFVHINLQFFWAARTHHKLKGKSGYFVCKYEDLVQYPQDTLKLLCEFLNVPFDSRMLQARAVLNTSFVSERQKINSFQTFSVNAWKSKIPKNVSKLIEFLHISAIKEFGYRN